MQKNDKFYTFLLSHSSGSKIKIRRIAIRKASVQFGSLGIFAAVCLTTFGIGVGNILGNIELPVLAESSLLSQVAARSAPADVGYGEAAGAELVFNSGGPELDIAEAEDGDLDDQLQAIRAKSDPANLPTMWAHLGKINNEFGFRRNPFGGRAYEFHAGMDIDGERGDFVVAPGNGTVISAGYKGGYGNMIEIDHGNGLTTRYGHLSKVEIEAGDTVERGQLIGYVGSTGRSTGPHLHYEVRIGERSINPRHFLPQEPTDLAKLVK
jgi:murein DD-endopeptidase MepM/ murein hydrolase activator NlpD